MTLSFTGYRKPFEIKSSLWTAFEQDQIRDMARKCGFENLLEDYLADPAAFRHAMEEWEMLYTELVDVVDEQGKVLYQMYFFDFGTAFVYVAGTVNEAAAACQHSLDISRDDLFRALGEAYARSEPRIEQRICFR